MSGFAKRIAFVLVMTAMGAAPPSEAAASPNLSVGVIDAASGVGLVPATCPKGVTYADGCAGAPSDGIVRFQNFFTASSDGYVTNDTASAQVIGSGIARESGQRAYAVTPPYNVAGVDFPVGYSRAAFGAGKDPADIANDPHPSTAAKCSYRPTGSSLGGPVVLCSGAADIEGYDFGMHGCTALYFNNAPGTTDVITIKNNRFVNGPSCTTSPTGAGPNGETKAGSSITASWGDAFPGYIVAGSTTLCAGAATQGQVEAANNSAFVLGGDQRIPAKTYITGEGTAGSCVAGFTPYMLNQAPNSNVGSSDSPSKLHEASTSLYVSKVNSGAPGVKQIVQYAGNAAVAHWGQTISACPSERCGETGRYTVSGDAQYIPSQDWITGKKLTMISTDVEVPADIIFTHNYVDGAYLVLPLASQSMLLRTTGSLVFRYNAIFRMQARPLSTQALDADFEDNYVEAFGSSKSAGHLEAFMTYPANNSTMRMMKYLNNTVLVTANTANSGTADIWATPEGSGQTVDQAIVQYNTLINNKNQFNHFGVIDTAIEIGGAKFLNVKIDGNYIDGTGIPSGCTTTFVKPDPTWLTNNYTLTKGTRISAWGLHPCENY